MNGDRDKLFIFLFEFSDFPVFMNLVVFMIIASFARYDKRRQYSTFRRQVI